MMRKMISAHKMAPTLTTKQVVTVYRSLPYQFDRHFQSRTVLGQVLLEGSMPGQHGTSRLHVGNAALWWLVWVITMFFYYGIKLWRLMLSFPCLIFYFFWVRIEFSTRECTIHCFNAGKKMQNLLDLFNRYFINATSQNRALDLVNLSVRNMQLTFSQSLLPTLSRYTLAPSPSLLGKAALLHTRKWKIIENLPVQEGFSMSGN